MSKQRLLVLDTETTGISYKNGHKIIEIGAVELIDRQVTGNNFHVYIDPGMEIDAGAVKVHGLTREDVVRAGGGKTFKDIADDFLAYIGNDELIIHNAPFDVGFLDHELNLCGRRPLTGYNKIFDTLKYAQNKFPNQRNNLDALAKRYNISVASRELHGALLDAEILCETYLCMTMQQNELMSSEAVDQKEASTGQGEKIKKYPPGDWNLPLI